MFPSARAIDPEFDAVDLEPARVRLAAAVADLRGTPGTAQHRLAAAWGRVAELRLPKMVAPAAVLDEVERLTALWDRAGRFGGITGAAYRLKPDEAETEAGRIVWMLDVTEDAVRRSAGTRPTGIEE